MSSPPPPDTGAEEQASDGTDPDPGTVARLTWGPDDLTIEAAGPA